MSMRRKFRYGFIVLYNIFRGIFIRLWWLNKVKINILENIHPGTRIICDNGKIRIGKFCHTEKNTTINANGGKINIGDRVFVNTNSNIVSHQSIVIENNVTIGPNVCIYDHDHDIYNFGKFVCKDVFIKSNVWIGANVVILKGVTIGENSVIGAGTVVSKDVPPNSICYSRGELVIKSKI